MRVNEEHPIKEFSEEIEPEDRHCLFCRAQPPTDLRTIDMKGGRGHWYSQALMHMATKRIARFYLCPKHIRHTNEAFEWVKDGFAEEAIADLKGMQAVNKWLEYHPHLLKKVER